ncbi:inhibitor of nuclear factor kappa-B kinase-interacting protein isoform X1 [Tachysurus vachellii]|uniref:inhibitor of nuclear factor kappa-B kinase-interacting protein isoform X1 n=1 Tax=Tachysurus vachellii TaxID=175792 RepID=UPI00296AEAE8|nr:inhibitor of nuclear factor kappa-B kinase-interacting protein isoform X1 [Tachysurus vachellii]
MGGVDVTAINALAREEPCATPRAAVKGFYVAAWRLRPTSKVQFDLSEGKYFSKMPSDGVKQRKGKAQNGDADTSPSGKTSQCSSVDLRTVVSLLSLSACFLLAWAMLQQNARFNEVEEKYNHLYEKAADLLALEKKFSAASRKCEDVQVQLANENVQVPLSQLSSLKQEMAQLKEWSSGLTERRQQLHTNLAQLTQAVERIENRTTAISSDVTAKVASVRTDVRRMGGLEGDVEGLLTQTNELEEKVSQVEKLMAKRIGEVLANSISRVAGLRSLMEKNTKSLEQMRKRIPELSITDTKLTERILALESGRAKLARTVMFASDLRPKVSTIKRDFAMLEPQLVDLTLRIGHLAEDLMKREEDISQIKESLANIAAVKKDLKQAQEVLTVEVTTDVPHQNDLSQTMNHTEL